MSKTSNLYPKNFKLWAVIPAAGSGRRFSAHTLKQYQLLQSKTVLEHSVAALQQLPLSACVLAISAHDDVARDLFSTDSTLHFCEGGDERVHSVLNALNYLSTFAAEDDWVLVHDAARPCVHLDNLNQLLQCAIELQHSAILATPVRDTLKKATTAMQSGHGGIAIQHTVSRVDLWQAQTPQIARLGQLKAALEKALADDLAITDEASALEHSGLVVNVVTGRADNIKITYPEDLNMADLILSAHHRNT